MAEGALHVGIIFCNSAVFANLQFASQAHQKWGVILANIKPVVQLIGRSKIRTIRRKTRPPAGMDYTSNFDKQVKTHQICPKALFRNISPVQFVIKEGLYESTQEVLITC